MSSTKGVAFDLRRVRACIAPLLWLFLSAAACVSSVMAAGPGQASAAPIIAIGDVHGDFAAWVSVLERSGLVDRRGRWTGGSARLVQLGDVPDRGADTRKILDHLMKLEKQARRDGGQVIALVGNHEAMNMTGDLRYVTAGEYAAFKSSQSRQLLDAFYRANRELFLQKYRSDMPERPEQEVRAAFAADFPAGYVEHRRAWAPQGPYGAWVAGHDAVRVIDRTLFVHGGISSVYVGRSADAINAEVRGALAAADANAPVLTEESSPLWYRGLVADTPEARAEVDAVLAAFDVDRIVVAHTPQLKGIRSFHGGRLLAVDTGISAYYGGTKSFLRIEPGRVTAVDDGVERTISTGDSPDAP